MTIITDETATAGGGTLAPSVPAGFIKLAAHPAALLVTPVLNIPVPPGERGERITALEEIAELLGTEITEQLGPDGKPDGTLIAEQWFDGVRVEAHLCHPDGSVSGYKARAALRAVPAQNGAAA